MSIDSKPHMPHNLDHQSFSANEIEKSVHCFKRAGLTKRTPACTIRHLCLEQAKEILSSSSKSQLAKIQLRTYSTEQLHTKFNWWGSEPQWWKVKEHAVLASRKSVISI